MSEFEITIELPGSQYGECIIVDKYNDQYGLSLAKKGTKGGTVFKQWCFPGYKKEPGKKAVPWKLPLGNMDDARQVAKQIAEAFGWAVTESKGGQGKATIPDDSEIPF